MSDQNNLSPAERQFRDSLLSQMQQGDPVDNPTPSTRKTRPTMSGLRERTETPLDLNPDTITENTFGDLLEGQRATLASGLQGVFDVESTVHRLQREKVPGEQIVANALPAANNALKRLDNAMERAYSFATHHDQKIREITQMPLAHAEAQELRAFVREQSDPVGFAVSRIMRGDARLSSAVLSAEPYLSGIADEHLVMLQTAAGETMAPEHFRARAAAQRGVQRLNDARDSFVRGLMPRLERWEKAREKAAKAERAFG